MAERRAIVVTGSNHFGEMPAGDVFPASSYAAAIAALHPLTPAADRLPYYSSGADAALATFTAFGRSLIDDADATAARTTLGLGSLATLNTINNANWSGTDLSVANGGTGASTLTGYVRGNGTSAMTASATIPNTDITGLGSMATQNATAVAITGGTINGASVGATTRSTGAFTTLSCTGSAVFASSSGSVLCGSAADNSTAVIAKGGGKAVRLGGNSTRAVLEGVDETGSASFQPLYIGGSALSLGIAGATTVSVTASGAEVTGLLDTRPTSGLLFRVMETGSGSARRIQFSNSGSVNTIESTTGSGSTVFAFAQDSVERMRFDTAGNLGLRTTAPTQALTVGDGSADTRVVSRPNSAFAYGMQNGANFGGWMGAIAADTVGFFNAAGTERMRITSGGDVVVGGTSAPFSAANRANIAAVGASSAIVSVSATGVNATYLYTDATGAELYNVQNTYLRFGTNNAERMRITSGGRVLIATTTDLGASYQLQVNGGGSFSGLLDVSLFRFAGYGTIASSTESAVGGELSYDGSYLYVATGTNTWKRAALSTF